MREILSEKQLAQELRKYVSKNRLINDFFQQVEANRSGFESTFNDLKTIIAAGNYREFRRLITAFDYSDLFEKIKLHDYQPSAAITWDVSLHLMYLIEKQEIPFWQGITFYNYAMALIEYSGDSCVVLFEPVALIENNEFSLQGMQFIENLIKNYQTEYAINLNQETLRSFILKLPPSEQTVFKVEFKFSKSFCDEFSLEDDRVEFARQLSSRMVYSERKDQQGNLPPFQQPAFGLLVYFLSLMGAEPMQIRPCLGRIGLNSLHLLHEKDQHLVALYSPYLKYYYKEVHEFNAGQWLVGQHDIGHVFWASVMQANYRDWIQTVLIPAYRQCINHILALTTPERGPLSVHIKEALESYIEALQDYEIAPAYKYVRSKPEETVVQYLLKIVRHVGMNFSRGLYIGVKSDELRGKVDLVDDVIVLILLRTLSQTPAADKMAPQLARIKELLIIEMNKTNRNVEMLNRLTTLVNGQSFTASIGSPLNQPARLLKIFKWAAKGGKHEEAAWRQFKEHPDFNRLILEANLKWYPPYIPLKQEECALVIEFIKPQIRTYADVMQELKEATHSNAWQRFFPLSQNETTDVCSDMLSSYRL